MFIFFLLVCCYAYACFSCLQPQPQPVTRTEPVSTVPVPDQSQRPQTIAFTFYNTCIASQFATHTSPSDQLMFFLRLLLGRKMKCSNQRPGYYNGSNNVPNRLLLLFMARGERGSPSPSPLAYPGGGGGGLIGMQPPRKYCKFVN